jgi:exodeoxyribonuclease-1
MLFRYRARNWPDSLDTKEQARWNDYRRHRLCQESGLSEFTFDQYFAEIALLRQAHPDSGSKQALLDQLEKWGRDLQDEL